MLATAILESVKAAIESGELPAELSSNRALNEITLERPKNRDHGDYATSIALALAKGAGKAPRQIAEII
ncbi:MAG: arginine--tRNA ligase, partial [Actinobacteria bacterium]|nr:arginine--tRNA ligase [Actinomycetota bacterium]